MIDAKHDWFNMLYEFQHCSTSVGGYYPLLLAVFNHYKDVYTQLSTTVHAGDGLTQGVQLPLTPRKSGRPGYVGGVSGYAPGTPTPKGHASPRVPWLNPFECFGPSFWMAGSLQYEFIQRMAANGWEWFPPNG